MTLRIETVANGKNRIIRLIGRIRAEHLEELKAQIGGSGRNIVLDMECVTLVDVDVVRFLGTCESEGIEVLHCPPYVREWIVRERDSRSEMPQHL